MDGHGHVVLNFYRKYLKQHFLGVGGGARQRSDAS